MCEYPGRSHRRIKVDVFEKKMRSNNELGEVSRGHSTEKNWEGPNNR